MWPAAPTRSTATFNNDGSITLGGNLNLNSVTTTGRNAGVSTAVGALIYNSTTDYNNAISSGKYDVMGVEVKMNGILSKEEKQKAKWLLDNNIFSVILVASKGEKRGEIKFEDFRERYSKLFSENV